MKFKYPFESERERERESRLSGLHYRDAVSRHLSRRSANAPWTDRTRFQSRWHTFHSRARTRGVIDHSCRDWHRAVTIRPERLFGARRGQKEQKPLNCSDRRRLLGSSADRRASGKARSVHTGSSILTLFDVTSQTYGRGASYT